MYFQSIGQIIADYYLKTINNKFFSNGTFLNHCRLHNKVNGKLDKNIGDYMSTYRFKSDRKHKKRRALVATIFVMLIIAIGMAAYLLLNNKDNIGTEPGDTTQASSTPTGTTPSDSTKVSVDVEPGDSTQDPASDSKVQNGVETKDHGFLPNYDSVKDSGKMEELQKLITDYTSKLPGTYGVTFIDLATGEMVNVNDKIEYIAASTSKLPINVLLYENIESGKVKMEDMLTYKQEDLEYGTGIIQQSAYGTQYTVRETSKLSIQKSDNCGVNMLIRLLGLENVRNYIDEVGGQVHYGARHRSCPYDMAMIAKQLYNHYLRNEVVYGELINYLENTDWSDRIDAKLPAEVKVAHKIGNQKRTANDVGIVFATHPYVLSIMTADVDEGAAYKSIADLSLKIYEFVEGYAQTDLK